MSVRVVQDTRGAGLKALEARMRELARERVLVGVPVGAAPEPDGASMALVAARVEFGDPATGQPERPFLRNGIRHAIPILARLQAANARAVADGHMPVSLALDLIGAAAAGEVQAYMAGPHFAANAPSTIAKKKSEQPTIADGNLRQSITHTRGPS